MATGPFAPCADVSTDTNGTFGVALGDVNGDTLLDAVFAELSDENRVCLGNGDGTFAPCSDVSTDTNDSIGVALGDVNGDTLLDAVFSNLGQANRVCEGIGDGTFTCSDVSGDTNDTWGVALMQTPRPETVLGHFACYEVSIPKGDPKFIKRGVHLLDQCIDADGDVNKPKSVCVPVPKNGEAILNLALHLTCYEVKSSEGTVELEALLDNQFGEQILKVNKVKTVCLPSYKRVLDP